MFSLLGVSREAVERLREKHHIYMTSDSRMNLAGIMAGQRELRGRGIRGRTGNLGALAPKSCRGF